MHTHAWVILRTQLFTSMRFGLLFSYRFLGHQEWSFFTLLFASKKESRVFGLFLQDQHNQNSASLNLLSRTFYYSPTTLRRRGVKRHCLAFYELNISMCESNVPFLLLFRLMIDRYVPIPFFVMRLGAWIRFLKYRQCLRGILRGEKSIFLKIVR